MELPLKFKEYMKDMLGEEYYNFISSYDAAPLYSGVRVNTLKTDGTDLEVVSKLKKIPWCETGYYADKTVINGKHPYHIGGLLYFQEPSAMAVVEALPISEGDFVLDLCAAPGGKSTQAAAKLNNTGLLVSNEIIKKRADILSENIERMGIRNAVVTNESPARLAERFPEFFDKIIVDAPCSGEGMFRKEQQAVAEWSIEHTESCAVRQRNILDCAVKMLKKGGMLVYSTCTFSVAENEDNAGYLIDTHGLSIQQIPNLSMIDNGIGLPYSKRIFPHRQGGEGHFIALFKKNGEAVSNATPACKPSKEIDAAAKLYREFEKSALNVRLDGTMYLFGSKLYLMPFYIDIDKLKVLRPGLHLGECKKGRFEPSHSLALALCKESFKNTIEFEIDNAEINEYLKGGVIKCEKKGYTAVICDGYSIGWGKASNGMLKNHFPKYLRLK